MLSEHVEAAASHQRSPFPGPRVEALLNVLLVPLLFPYSLFSAVMRYLRRKRSLTDEPRFRIAGTAEPLEDAAAFASEAQRENPHPRAGWGSLDFQMQYAPDLIASVVDLFPKRAGRMFFCPEPFREVQFTSFDGTTIYAQMATRDDRDRPGLVVVHGSFGASGQALYAAQAIEAFSEWGFNVIAIDLRGWGRSAELSDAAITCGWREAEDVLAAAQFLKESSRTTTVGAVGYSLGGGSVLKAATHELAPELLAGGVMSESGFANARTVVEHLAENPGLLSPRYLPYWIFRLGFGVKFRAFGYKNVAIASYPDVVVSKHYGVTLDELWERASVITDADAISVPALQLHAEDDWIVPVEQAQELRAAAARNRRVGVCIMHRGAHCSFARVMGRWRSDLARKFFAGVAGVRLEDTR